MEFEKELKKTEIYNRCKFTAGYLRPVQELDLHDWSGAQDDLIEQIGEITVSDWYKLVIPTLFVTAYSSRLLAHDLENQHGTQIIQDLLLVAYDVGEVDDLAAIGDDICKLLSSERFFRDENNNNSAFLCSIFSLGLAFRRIYNSRNPKLDVEDSGPPAKVSQNIIDFLDTLDMSGI